MSTGKHFLLPPPPFAMTKGDSWRTFFATFDGVPDSGKGYTGVISKIAFDPGATLDFEGRVHKDES